MSSEPIVLFSAHFENQPYEQLAEITKRLGFDGIDLTVRPGGHVLPEQVARDLPRAVKAFEQAGLHVPLITTALTSIEDPYAEQILKTAAAMGVQQYRLGWLRHVRNTSPLEKLSEFQAHLARLSELNNRIGIVGGYQNHAGPRYVGSSIWELWALLKEVDAEYLGVQYDIRHAMVESVYSWPEQLELIAPYVKSLVWKDFAWDPQAPRPPVRNVPLGEGMVPLAEMRARMTALGISVPISLHAPHISGDNIEGQIAGDLNMARSLLTE